METGTLTVDYMTCQNETEFTFPMVTIRTNEEGMIWFNIPQMAELLECYTGTVSSNLRALFKSGVLWEEDCTYSYQPDFPGNHPSSPKCTCYNLEVLLALCFRIRTRNSTVIRKWAVRKLTEQPVSHLMLWSD